MTKSKHTAGPWTIELGRNGWDDNASIIGADGSFVAQVQWANDSKLGNARLISASTDLFESLQDIVAAADGSGWLQLDATLAKARAAIAKATGA